MTLRELQEVLGDVISTITREDLSPERRAIERDKAESVARIAKQMINNADVVLRTDKLIAENKLSEQSNIAKMV